MRTTVYNHRSGQDVVNEDIVNEIIDILRNIKPRATKNSISEIRQEIIDGLTKQGWTGEYRLDVTSKITISSYKEGIGLCIQTGNVARIYADLLKLQTLFLKGNIKAGIIVLPQKELAVKLSSNLASFERLVGELPIFDQVISMPILIMGFDEEVK